MSTKYGRVSQPDKIPISTPADAHEYTDDINGNGYNRNGIYNDPVYTVEMSPKPYKDTFRIGCFRCQNTKRNKFILIGGLIIVVFTVILIIIAAASHSKKKSGPESPNQKQGLIAFGPDKSGIMRFNPVDASTYADELERIDTAVHTYSAVKQLDDPDKYATCTNDMTALPDSKVCRQTTMDFGQRCQMYDVYGLHAGQPCVLLVLKLAKGDPAPLPLDTYNDAVTMERYSNTSVGISCKGKTPADDDNLGIGGSKLLGPIVDYNPETGFPVKFFKLRNNNPDWVHPAVMVQFRDVKVKVEVTVRCTAWAQNFNDGEPQNSPIYSTEFKLDVFN